MRLIIAAVALGASATVAQAQYYGYGSNSRSNSVSGYTTNNGTYVAPHNRTNPNSTQYDNYGTSGNYNPHNGAYGSRNPRY